MEKKQKVVNLDNMNLDSDEDDEGHFDLLSRPIQEEEEEEDSLLNERDRIGILDNFPPVNELVIYEHIVPTKNTSKGLHQYVANKPNKWGYKLWKLVAGNGYLVNFDVYKGKGSLNKNEKMGETVVKQLINDKFFNKNSIYLKFLKIDTVGVTRESKKNLEDFLFEKKLEIYQFEWVVHVNYDISILRICDTKEFVMVQTIKDPTTRGEDYKSNSIGRMNSESIKHSSVLVSYRMNMGIATAKIKECYLGHNKKW
ncbi:hypothetical protein ACTFIY_008904 [Dictyostelium cf. discoideum]